MNTTSQQVLDNFIARRATLQQMLDARPTGYIVVISELGIRYENGKPNACGVEQATVFASRSAAADAARVTKNGAGTRGTATHIAEALRAAIVGTDKAIELVKQYAP